MYHHHVGLSAFFLKIDPQKHYCTNYHCRSKHGSTAAHWLRWWARIPPGAWMSVFVNIVCCQVEVSATGWSLVQESYRVLCVCDRGTSQRGPRPTRAVELWRNELPLILTNFIWNISFIWQIFNETQGQILPVKHITFTFAIHKHEYSLGVQNGIGNI
jgi:hypothetical protein